MRLVAGLPVSQWRSKGLPAKYRKPIKTVVVFSCWDYTRAEQQAVDEESAAG